MAHNTFSRRAALSLSAALVAAAWQRAGRVAPGNEPPAIKEAVARGLMWLLDQQAADGGWHSTTYGNLRDGAAATSIALWCLAACVDPASNQADAAVDRATRFLQAGFKKRKIVASPDGSLDYPTYAAALLLQATQRFPMIDKVIPAQDLTRYLIAAQLTEQKGFKRDSPDFGGWDLLGGDDAEGVTTGSNISITSTVIDALTTIESPEAKAACATAQPWLRRCQEICRDGGFAFSPDPSSLNNKAQWRDAPHKQPRSYGSATADGLRALIKLGGAEQQVQRASNWLLEHPNTLLVPGFEEAPPEVGWREGLRFYYAQALAQVLPSLLQEVSRQCMRELVEGLLHDQKPTGYWQNESSRMREDDPLIATAFALRALACLV